MILRNIGRYCVLAAVGGGLAACASPQMSDVELPKPGQDLFVSKTLPNGETLELEVRPTNSEYRISSGDSKKVLASARSAIVSEDIEESKFRGTLNIISTPNGSVLIQEDVSESSPAMSCIYFKRSGESGYDVFYLDLPIARWGRHPLEFELSDMTAATDKSVTLYYRISKKKRTIRISSVPSSLTPVK